ncbi:GAF domain-containing protein [Ramlibacter alkalitolerans]|uniref:GAF domain-containing protein n=1 Tax=Ramlibacter alkalitolerans TaxID=2039631 RepID=A0ABS1JMU1_9BURK|nr:GAF domain-containing protein [Ramlibacter alkalitolerans]MBL0425573.1 GAF domain-containing protein [Ramlibacter alkalitolerans]
MQLFDPPAALASLTADERLLVLAAYERAQALLEAGAPLREVLAQLTSAIEALGQARTVSSILVLDREGLLRNGASPNLPADYLDAIDRLKPDARVGTCAAAAATGEIVDTPSFLDDLRWAELRHLPLALGFLGAWSMPIKNGEGRVLGTFGTYFREHRLATPGERESVALLAGLAASAIEANAFA